MTEPENTKQEKPVTISDLRPPASGLGENVMVSVPKYLVDDLKNRMVNVWTADPNRGVQGILLDYDQMFFRVKGTDGRDLYFSWQSGPIIQKI